MKKFIILSFIFISSFYLFAEGTNLGKPASTIAEEIYGKDSVEMIAKNKINNTSYEYAFVKINADRFLVLKSEKFVGEDYNVYLFAAVDVDEDKEKIRNIVTELNENASKEGDSSCTVFTYYIYGKPIYFFIINGKLYSSFCFINELYGKGKYQVECYIDDQEVIASLENLVEKWNKYQDNELLKSLGL